MMMKIVQLLYCAFSFIAATSNLGDSLAGLTVFGTNEEDPYITIKDTVRHTQLEKSNVF